MRHASQMTQYAANARLKVATDQCSILAQRISRCYINAVSLMSHIEFHPNPKTNLKGKTNPNPNLQNTFEKLEKNVKNNSTHGS